MCEHAVIGEYITHKYEGLLFRFWYMYTVTCLLEVEPPQNPVWCFNNNILGHTHTNTYNTEHGLSSPHTLQYIPGHQYVDTRVVLRGHHYLHPEHRDARIATAATPFR